MGARDSSPDHSEKTKRTSQAHAFVGAGCGAGAGTGAGAETPAGAGTGGLLGGAYGAGAGTGTQTWTTGGSTTPRKTNTLDLMFCNQNSSMGRPSRERSAADSPAGIFSFARSGVMSPLPGCVSRNNCQGISVDSLCRTVLGDLICFCGEMEESLVRTLSSTKYVASLNCRIFSESTPSRLRNTSSGAGESGSSGPDEGMSDSTSKGAVCETGRASRERVAEAWGGGTGAG